MDLSKKKHTFRYIRLPDILDMLDISPSTWWNGIKMGHYPKGYQISTNVTAWRSDEIEHLFMSFPHSSKDGGAS